MKNSKAITFVELLIVILVVSLLMRAFIPRLTSILPKVRDTSRASLVNQTSAALTMLFDEAGSLTTTGAICFNEFSDLAGTINGIQKDIGSYLPSIPTDPITDHDNAPGSFLCTGYIYIYAGDNFAYVYADFEQERGAITSAPGDMIDTIPEFLGLAGGHDGFGILVR